MKIKPINVDQLRKYFEYRDGELIRKQRIGRSGPAGSAIRGNKTTNGYLEMRFMGVTYFVHRVVFALCRGFLPEQLDHIDGDRKNYRIENLRVATYSKNAMNSAKRVTNVSGVKGLHYDKNQSTWVGRIQTNHQLQTRKSKNRSLVVDWLAEKRAELHQEFARD